MPSYTFENKKTGKVWTDIMTIDEMEKYLKKNKNVRQIITSINIVAGVSGMSYRSDKGWNETLSKIAEKHPQSKLAQDMGTKSTKQIKTEQVMAKHRKKWASKRNAKSK
jgi:hypothetical protein|tara:strand:- start:929 stop:1255 length:327 start_codon:yes stop_codon:yes gene_type:complete